MLRTEFNYAYISCYFSYLKRKFRSLTVYAGTKSNDCWKTAAPFRSLRLSRVKRPSVLVKGVPSIMTPRIKDMYVGMA